MHSDHLDTPKVLTDASDAIAWRASHEAFGKAALDTNNDVTFNLRFPRQYCDAESGLHYNRFRTYDPSIGRYISADPIGQRLEPNIYTYARNTPMQLTDPLGLTWAESIGMFFDWATGSGSADRLFGPDSNQAKDLMDSPGVNAARDFFYRKNSDRFMCGEDVPPLQGVEDFGVGFGLMGLVRAGTDPTEQFVGSFDVEISPNEDATELDFEVTNNTSFTSFFYGMGDSWERSTRGPGGNMRQTYRWSEPIR